MIQEVRRGRTVRAMPGTRLGEAGAVIELTLAIVAATVRAVGSAIGQRHAEGLLPTVAFGVVLAAPGLLALLGVWMQRPVMLGAAGIACFPLAVMSVIVFPIVLPAVLLLVAFGQTSTGGPTSKLRSVAAFVSPLILLVVASSLLVFGMQPYSYTSATGGEAGAYVTASHAGFAVVLVVVSLAFALFVAPPFAETPATW